MSIHCQGLQTVNRQRNMWNDISASLKISFYESFSRASLAETRKVQAALAGEG